MSELIPEGNYPAKAIDASYGVSSKQGTRFLAITCEITKGKYAGRTSVWHGWFNTESNSDKAMQSLVLAGWDCVDPLAIGAANGLGSTEFDIAIEIEAGGPKLSDSGEQEQNEDGMPAFFPSRNRIAWINDPNSTTIGRKLEPQEAAAMGDNLRKLMALKGYKPVARASSGSAPPKQYAGTNGGSPPPAAPPAQTTSGRALPI